MEPNKAATGSVIPERKVNKKILIRFIPTFDSNKAVSIPSSIL